jgi:hypothetical protein
MLKIPACIMMLLWSSTIFSQNVRTKLVTPAAWSNASGWFPNGVPVSGERIIIPAGVTVTTSTDLIFSSLYLDILGTLVLGNNRSLTLNSPGSYINLQGTGSIEASQTSNSNSKIIINGLTQFVSNQTYSTNGGGQGLIKGPALSTGAATGFAFGIVLPVKFSNIQVQQLTKSASIKWQTSTELSTRYFTIERSADARSWTAIGTVTATTVTSNRYQYLDLHPLNGAGYYRVCAADVDGSKTYSEIIATQFETQMKIDVSPNPARSICRLTVPSAISSSKIKYYIYSSTGLLIDNGTVSTAGPSTNFNITYLSNGAYQVVVLSDTGLRYNTSLLVQH